MKISSILATKGTHVFTIRPTQTIREALALLNQYNIGALVVVNATETPVGILSERDIVRYAARDEHLFDLPVSRLMTTPVVLGSPTDDLNSVLNTMTQRRFRHLPIVEQGKLAGMITLGDVVKARLDEYKGEIENLETQITRG